MINGSISLKYGSEAIVGVLYFKDHPFVFVGKAELSKIPFFGVIYKRACILVDRSSPESRKSVFFYTQRRLADGLSICIYPEGGVPDPSVALDKFKKGAFKIAIEHQIPIVCLTFLDNKKRFPFAFFSGKPGRLRVKYHKPQSTFGLTQSEVSITSDRFRNLILEVKGVQSIEKLEFTNKSGTALGYSQYKYDFPGATRKGVIYPSLDPSIFELKYPNTDIKGKVVNL